MANGLRLLLLTLVALAGVGRGELKLGADYSEVMYEWVRLDEQAYDFSTEGGSEAYKEWVEGKKLSPDNAFTHGIKIYEGQVLVSVPRLGPGIPSTLNKVVEKDGRALLQPFPSWAWQKLGDCSAFQTVQSFEVDPHKGWLWVIDSGRTQTFMGGVQNLCPPKIVIYNMKTGETVRHYVFPNDIVDHTGNFLSDIVVDNDLDIAYISNLGEGAMAMYSYSRNQSIRFFDRTTYPTNLTPVKIHDDYINLNDNSAGVDGLALSPDGRFFYYGQLAEPVFYQVNTSFMHACFEHPKWARNLDMFAVKMHQPSSDGHTRGRVMGERSMFYGGMGSDSIYRWHWYEDAYGKSSVFDMRMKRRDVLVWDTERILWVESMGIDGKAGYLWFTSINLAKYFLKKLDFSGESGPNMYIWRVFVNEGSYNLPYHPTPAPPSTTTPPSPVVFDRGQHYQVNKRVQSDSGCQSAKGTASRVLSLLLAALMVTINAI